MRKKTFRESGQRFFNFCFLIKKALFLILIVTGPPHPLAGSVERPRGGVHQHDVPSEVSSVLP